MATLATDTPPASPPFHRRRKSWARRVERVCCTTLSYFPLSFVYGLTTWAVWVEVTASFLGGQTWNSYLKAGLALLFYGLANTSYTIAVFTSPGSPLDPRQDLSHRGQTRRTSAIYEGLPMHEDHEEEEEEGLRTQASHGPMTTVTAKSTGSMRYCKKCRCVKPDRAHHCSTCKRCVLKMDHHCPWLATCVGLRNYKPFLLFLIYTSLFCWTCLAVSSRWVWRAIIADSHMEESLRVVNCIMLAVLSGIIGLVLSGFTAWHIYLAITGQTTIESLEKTRYLSPLRKKLEPRSESQRHYLSDTEAQTPPEQGLLEQLKETHANALPGVLRPEEGEASTSRSITPEPSASGTVISPAKNALHRSYASLEEQRERERYAAYLDEQDSEKLPNAFDMGWRYNLTHLFGDRPLLWLLPVCNTSGDGWMWEVSPKWIETRAEIARERAAREREEAIWRQERQNWETRSAMPQPPPRDLRWTPGQGFARQGTSHANGAPMPLQPLDRRKGGPAFPSSARTGDGQDVYDTSSDEDAVARREHRRTGEATANWNDIPEDFLASERRGLSRTSRSHSRGRQER